MTEIARMFGRQGGRAPARNMTAEERSARAKKASLAAAEVRTATRLAREGLKAGQADCQAETVWTSELG